MADAQVKLAEGKTKVIWDAGDGKVTIESKDDITAGDGAKHDMLEGKAITANQTTSNVFALLKAKGLATHFIERTADRAFKARSAKMIPLELVARRIATGSYLKRRPDVKEGTIFGDLVVEFFEKDDPNHDPLVIFDFVTGRLLRYTASKPLGEGFMNEQPLAETIFKDLDAPQILTLVELTKQAFEVLEAAWAEQEVTLVDLKIEAGRDAETDELFIADVVDNDSWRIWPGGDKSQMKDKQVYRNLAGVDDPAAKAKELGKIKQNYTWVAEATEKFSQGE
ncbi:MAG TPA: phosphoribosylaminoimidazolesuccinocarboxamide synthase [Candidatus Saccharimonadia bacterium]|nr:phosphoribosylaminoimidazolesuccinocarboxamide synthase [Candidatus Saccharimonadia bacterium]